MSEAEASVGSGVAEGGAAAAPAPSEAAADKPKIARPKRPTATTTESPATGDAGGETDATRSVASISPESQPVSPDTSEEEAKCVEVAQWCSLGMRVEIEGYTCPGTVRFVGLVGGVCRVGAELDQPFGKNDGFAVGQRFFLCPPKRGTFVFPKKVKAIEGEPLVVVVGQKVRVDDIACEGVVRFVGKIGGKARAGIELDEKLGKNNGTAKGTVYFECAQGHGMFAYIEKVHPI